MSAAPSLRDYPWPPAQPAESSDERHLRLFSAALDRGDLVEAAMIASETSVCRNDVFVGYGLHSGGPDFGHVYLSVLPLGEGKRRHTWTWPLVWEGRCPVPWRGCPDGLLPLLMATVGTAEELVEGVMPDALGFMPDEAKPDRHAFDELPSVAEREESRRALLEEMADTWGSR